MSMCVSAKSDHVHFKSLEKIKTICLAVTDGTHVYLSDPKSSRLTHACTCLRLAQPKLVEVLICG